MPKMENNSEESEQEVRDIPKTRKPKSPLKVRVITREEIVKMVSKETGYFQSDIKEIIDSLAGIYERTFLNIGVDEQVEIKLIDGMKFVGYYVPEHQATGISFNGTGIVQPSIQISGKVAKNYKYKITKKFREINGIN